MQTGAGAQAGGVARCSPKGELEAVWGLANCRLDPGTWRENWESFYSPVRLWVESWL